MEGKEILSAEQAKNHIGIMQCLRGLLYAHNLDFNLVNMTGYTIRDVYIAPTTQREWGEDIMGREFLEAGETVEITFDGGETETLWDIYITWEGYDPSEDRYWIGLDLSEISEVALYYDAETGKTWAKTK